MARRRALLAATLGLVAPKLWATSVITAWKGRPAAPPLDLLTPDGAPLSLAALRDKVVVVNFWATWCEPCVAEMPSLQHLRDRLAPRLEVLGVNHQEGPARIKGFVEKNRITFPVVRDTDGSAAKAWGVRIFPASFVVDRVGHVKHVVVGEADWTSAKLLSTIDPLL
jgi:thiol-disulfide isomerase/thioredoxin